MNIAEGKYWDQSWSPIRGCSHASAGCKACWAARMAGRFSDPGSPFHGFATQDGWTGRVELIESELVKPLHWKKPRVVALNWMGDLFHEKVPDEAIDRVFAVMALCPQHRFLVLTKRAKRMRGWLSNVRHTAVIDEMRARGIDASALRWPLPNVALGVSVEDAAHLSRLDDLRQTPAALRWVSFEPLLGDLGRINLEGIGWCVVGGESGPGARPMHPDWARSVRDQCQAAGVPFFFKQWGEHFPISRTDGIHELPFGDYNPQTGHGFKRVGKTSAGRLLDGRTWDELPEFLKVNP